MNDRNLTNEAFEYLSKSDEERIIYCKKDHWIGYGSAVKLIEILEDKFLDPPQMRHEGLLIYGDSNNGKTAILKRMYELHKTKLDYVTKDGEAIYEIHIIHFQAPTVPDESRLYSLILDELCVPQNRIEKVAIKANLAKHLLNKLGTRMILIDEIHSALRGNLNKQRTPILGKDDSLKIILQNER